MRFDTFMDAEKEVMRLEAKVAQLEAALDSLHGRVTEGSCCGSSVKEPTVKVETAK